MLSCQTMIASVDSPTSTFQDVSIAISRIKFIRTQTINGHTDHTHSSPTPNVSAQWYSNIEHFCSLDTPVEAVLYSNLSTKFHSQVDIWFIQFVASVLLLRKSSDYQQKSLISATSQCQQNELTANLPNYWPGPTATPRDQNLVSN